MRRRLLPLSILALLLAACAPASEPTTTVREMGDTTTLAPSTDTTPGPLEDPSTTSTAQPEAAGTTSDRPLAPDFTLELGGGGSYTLSEGAKPVYLVFWAEW